MEIFQAMLGRSREMLVAFPGPPAKTNPQAQRFELARREVDVILREAARLHDPAEGAG